MHLTNPILHSSLVVFSVGITLCRPGCVRNPDQLLVFVSSAHLSVVTEALGLEAAQTRDEEEDSPDDDVGELHEAFRNTV